MTATRRSTEVACAVGEMLRHLDLRIAVAESCTGGALADAITDIPGSSGYFLAGVVAYGNDAKTGLLGIDADDLARHGAVSEEVARAMARQAARVLGAEIGLSTTGIAGPGGGTPDKPVGTIWIAYHGPDGSEARLLRFDSDRLGNKALGVAASLELLYERLQELQLNRDRP